MLCTMESALYYCLLVPLCSQHSEMCENQVKSERNDDGNRGILEIASSQPEDLGFSFCEDW